MNGKTIYFLTNVIAPLFVGLGIYFIRQSEVLPFKEALLHITTTILYVLPDFLWLYALLHSMSLIWQADKRVWFWLILCTILSIGSEIFQLHGYIPGTFDYLDITAYLMAFLIVSIHTSIPQLKTIPA